MVVLQPSKLAIPVRFWVSAPMFKNKLSTSCPVCNGQMHAKYTVNIFEEDDRVQHNLFNDEEEAKQFFNRISSSNKELKY
jgi:excinuclease UvrABC ATPase subunit